MAVRLEDKGRKFKRIRQSPKERLQLSSAGLQPVLSSNVSAIAKRDKNLIIRFHGGATYSYSGAADLYEPMLESNSKGSFVWQRLIRPKVPYRRIGSVPLQSDAQFTDRDVMAASEKVRKRIKPLIQVVTLAQLKDLNLVIQNKLPFMV